jgi:hypothetical protein
MGPLETTSATIADVDGDRAPDTLFTNQMEETVTIWWGRVGEMPTERTEVPIGRSHASVAVGDVDGNGTLDLVAALQDDAAFGIAHGMGGRQFGAPERLFQSPPPSFVALADVTGDTGLDILYGELFHNVMVRERSGGSWLPHQKLLGLEATTQVVGLTSASKQFFLLLTGRQGFTVRSLDGRRESIINALTRWVPGSQGSEATYALHGSGNLVRRSADDTLCAVGPYTAPWTPAAAVGGRMLEAPAVSGKLEAKMDVAPALTAVNRMGEVLDDAKPQVIFLLPFTFPFFFYGCLFLS